MENEEELIQLLKEHIKLEENSLRYQQEQRKFEVLKLERKLDVAKNKKIKSAILAGMSILGLGAAMHLENVNPYLAFNYNLNAILSWDMFIKALNYMGPSVTAMGISSIYLVVLAIKNYYHYIDVLNEFEDFNNSLQYKVEDSRELKNEINTRRLINTKRKL